MTVAVRALVATAVAVGCTGKRAERVPPELLELSAERLLVTGPVAAGSAEATATYVLVDVTNRADRDAFVAVRGELLDAAEISLGPTIRETLRIAAGETRLFALVDGKKRRLDTATGSRLAIEAASFAKGPANVVVSGAQVHIDEGRAVVEGYIENRARNPVRAVVIAAFYDAGGAPVKRAATLFEIDGGMRRSAQFVGPPGSTRAGLFIGDHIY